MVTDLETCFFGYAQIRPNAIAEFDMAISVDGRLEVRRRRGVQRSVSRTTFELEDVLIVIDVFFIIVFALQLVIIRIGLDGVTIAWTGISGKGRRDDIKQLADSFAFDAWKTVL